MTSTVDSYNLNSPDSIAGIVYLAVIGPCVFILQPGYVQGLVGYLGFSEPQAANIASAEMFGLATMAVLLNFIISRHDWRRLTLVFVVISCLGNLLTVGQTDIDVLQVLRFLTGLGSGGLISITFTMMGLTRRSERNFGYIVTFVLVYGALGILVMPAAFQTIGMNGVLMFFALFCASGLAFINRLPRSSGHARPSATARNTYHWPIKIIALAAILLYNLGIGIVWVYLFLVGVEAGIPEQSVANALTLSQFLGIAGAFLAVILERRLGRLSPLFFGVIGGAAGIALLLGDIGYSRYAAGVCLFNLLWNLSMPYLLSTLADFDDRGHMVAYGVSMQMIGYAAGPALAAVLFTSAGYDAVNTAAIAMLVASMALLVPCVRLQHKPLTGAA
jgi:predicted MFS family arabinose efflux permease